MITQTRSSRLLWSSDHLVALPDLEWLWENWLPRGELVLLAGKQGSAKSTLALQLAHTVAEGGELPDGTTARKGRVLYFDLEGSPEATGKRVRELGLNSNSMKWCFEDSVPRGQKRLEFLLFLVRNGNYDLAVVDTYRGLHTGDERRADHARHVLDLLRGVAQEHRTTILLIHHLNKQSSKNELDSVSGSSDLTARPRVVWLLKREGQERLLKVGKTNLGPEPEPIRFEMIEGRLSPVEQDDLMSALDKACEFLQSHLSIGPQAAQALYNDALGRGISKRTLERAKGVLGLSSQKMGDIWVWTR